MGSPIKLVLAQMEIEPNLEKNLDKILEILQNIEGEVYLFPELSLTGYQDLSKLAPSQIKRALEEIQAKAGPKIILMGAPYPQTPYTNGYFSISAKGIELLAEKQLLFPGLDDKIGLHIGFRRGCLQLREGIRLGIILCFELRSPELARSFIAEGVSGMVVPAQWPAVRIEHFVSLLKARAIENQHYVLGINAVGRIDDLILGGRSRIYGPSGEEIISLGEREEIAQISLDFESKILPYPLKTPYTGKGKLKSLEELLEITARRRRLGQIMVFTNGCFDILHAGHVDYLAQARAQGDFLVVGLNSDLSVRKIKGKERPINTQELRTKVLSSLDSVDYIVLFDDETPEELIKALRPDILVKGADWEEDKIVGANFVKSYGGKVIRIPFTYEISTSKIWEKLVKGRSA